MPTYEYACEACGHELEARQSFDDDPLTICPSCGADTLERLVSRSSFALKGAGWYSDGYGAKKEEKKEDSKPVAKAEAKPEAAPEAKSEPKAEAKEAPKKVEPTKTESS
ncbi:MAG: zinc ribbon domain-containing protein [Deltaproteobacteria bacterium]|nr:zinc ribbon domain-containing protein [Deltaproteobacteria bacterium]